MTQEQLQEWVELYNLDLLEGDDKVMFEQALEQDVNLRKMLGEHRAFLRLVNHKTSKVLVQNQLQLIRKENKHSIQRIAETMQVHVNKYWKTAAVAATVALFASTITFQVAKNSVEKQMTANIKMLNGINAKQKALDTKVNKLGTQIKNQTEQPQGDSKKFGTCFAINNNGYALTNAHVVDGSKEIYIVNDNNQYYKASVVKVDESLDIALLKTNSEAFNGTVPYKITEKQSALSEKVYSVGFPKNSMAYNEGYISSKSGKDENEQHYQMELPSDPGVSGSPVFDASGNVIAMINSKESIGSNATYTLKSNEIIKFLKDVDSVKLNSSNALTSLPRTKQVNKLSNSVLMVKVY
jgi:serine protease Do